MPPTIINNDNADNTLITIMCRSYAFIQGSYINFSYMNPLNSTAFLLGRNLHSRLFFR